jgi:hypothetical protein
MTCKMAATEEEVTSGPWSLQATETENLGEHLGCSRLRARVPRPGLTGLPCPGAGVASNKASLAGWQKIAPLGGV